MVDPCKYGWDKFAALLKADWSVFQKMPVSKDTSEKEVYV